jgi:hypothetical protein
VSDEEEIARFGDANFGTIVNRYLPQYVRGICSIDTVYGFRGETYGTFMIGDSPFSVDVDGHVTAQA